jgi:predicted RNA methylase
LDIPQIQFKVYSSVERHRTENFGGEREALEKFLDVLEPGDIIYDVGASVGLFAIAASEKVPNGSVIAFEPDPETNQRLRANVDLNGVGNVQVVDWAASASSGNVELYTDGADGFAPTMRRQNREGACTYRDS